MPERAHILVVEDDAALRGLLVESLETEGYRVTSVGDGCAALAALGGGGGYGLVITDLGLPEMDGAAFLVAYRARGGRVPVLCVTGSSGQGGNVLALDAAAYLPKPFELDDLMAIVERLTGTDGAEN